MSAWKYMSAAARREAIVTGHEDGLGVQDLVDLYGAPIGAVTQIMEKIHGLNMTADTVDEIPADDRKGGRDDVDHSIGTQDTIVDFLEEAGAGPETERSDPVPVTPIRAGADPVTVVNSVESLESWMCKWPIGDVGDDDFHFCGRRVFGESSYCESHHRDAHHTPVREKSEEERERHRFAALKHRSRLAAEKLKE